MRGRPPAVPGVTSIRDLLVADFVMVRVFSYPAVALIQPDIALASCPGPSTTVPEPLLARHEREPSTRSSVDAYARQMRTVA